MYNNQDLLELPVNINTGMVTVSSSHTQCSASSREWQMRGMAPLPVFQGLLQTMECFRFLRIFCCVSGKALTIQTFRWQCTVEYNCQSLYTSTHIMTSAYPWSSISSKAATLTPKQPLVNLRNSALNAGIWTHDIQNSYYLHFRYCIKCNATVGTIWLFHTSQSSRIIVFSCSFSLM